MRAWKNKPTRSKKSLHYKIPNHALSYRPLPRQRPRNRSKLGPTKRSMQACISLSPLKHTGKLEKIFLLGITQLQIYTRKNLRLQRTFQGSIEFFCRHSVLKQLMMKKQNALQVSKQLQVSKHAAKQRQKLLKGVVFPLPVPKKALVSRLPCAV